MTMHRSDHDQWCAPLASGRAHELPNALRQELEACSVCSQRVAELRGLRLDLDELGREQREMFEAAQRLDESPAEGRFESELRARAASDALARARRSRWRVWAASVAALLVLGGAAALGWWLRGPAPERDRGVLGDPSIVLKAPGASVHRGEAFEWEAALPPQGHFEVRVESLDGSQAALSFVAAGLRWTPDDVQWNSLPREFYWSLAVVDPLAPGPVLSSRRRCSRAD